MMPSTGRALRSGGPPEDRARRAAGQSAAWLQEVAGAHNEHLVAALRRLKQFLETTSALPVSPDAIHASLDVLYPQKVRRFRWAVVHERGVALLQARGASDPEECFFLFVSWLFMGIGYATDPLFPLRDIQHLPCSERRQAAIDFLRQPFA